MRAQVLFLKKKISSFYNTLPPQHHSIQCKLYQAMDFCQCFDKAYTLFLSATFFELVHFGLQRKKKKLRKNVTASFLFSLDKLH